MRGVDRGAGKRAGLAAERHRAVPRSGAAPVSSSGDFRLPGVSLSQRAAEVSFVVWHAKDQIKPALTCIQGNMQPTEFPFQMQVDS